MRMDKLKIIYIFSLLLFSTNLYAVDSGGNASNVFNFQQKLAAKGDAQAQYQSGFMYETGEGVEADIDMARLWYQKAADQGHIAAAYRLTYLDIRENGFKPDQHAQWLSDVKNNASISKQEVLFLLGQMYHYGIGVKRDLNKSLEIMYQLGLEGMTAADSEIEKIQAEQKAREIQRRKAHAASARKKAAKAAPVQAKAKQAPAKPAASGKAAASATPKQAATATDRKTAAAAEDDKEARRKRYEAIMKKLAEEQAEINRLQGQVEGKDEAEIDDEI